ncbi:MAG: hypothetical protein F4X81_17200 [Gammaproteobacteria bacterium]|nr:hypothetical protein [Gammaproteobacteria bacterium]MYE53192.1 hypothetical protein [Gammaproteobacteria bacterium]MYF50631.1 hypothetical protein [Gammaproteobacteria bacterium]
MTPLVLSLKPHYAEMLFMGVKTIELRRRFATGLEGREVFVYVSSPVQKIWGGFRVDEVWSGTPEDVWGRVEARAGVERTEYDAYYSGSGVAHALHVSHVWEHGAPVALGAIRDELPEFRPPQSWRYAKGRELIWFEEFKREAQPIPGSFPIDFLLVSEECSDSRQIGRRGGNAPHALDEDVGQAV